MKFVSGCNGRSMAPYRDTAVTQIYRSTVGLSLYQVRRIKNKCDTSCTDLNNPILPVIIVLVPPHFASRRVSNQSDSF